MRTWSSRSLGTWSFWSLGLIGAGAVASPPTATAGVCAAAAGWPRRRFGGVPWSAGGVPGGAGVRLGRGARGICRGARFDRRCFGSCLRNGCDRRRGQRSWIRRGCLRCLGSSSSRRRG
ncbi:hypothetical protein GGR52DRAFT_565244 [Hypoxylon sp. FL1284]|nr:hypothetical protein GGR52DRAFT_565244 [Hypoxylon sp. FL1284]